MRWGSLVLVTSTVNLISHGSVVSRWDDRWGHWTPSAGWPLILGTDYEYHHRPSTDDPQGEMYCRYKFRGGAVVTSTRLRELLDNARVTGDTRVVID